MDVVIKWVFGVCAVAMVALQPAVASAKPAAPTAGAKPGVSLCQPVPVKTFHGKRMQAYCRLAKIERGQVPCMHADTFKVTRCAFTPSSGEWLETTSGEILAVAGQAITRNGRRGGMYTIASKLGKNGRPPCAQPKNKKRPTAFAADSVGTSAGTEFGGMGVCTMEVLGSSKNATGIPLRHYTSKQVCTSSYPHPDGAQLVSQPSAGVYCYTGQGAGLNNDRGQEHDIYGTPFRGSEYCHVGWNGNYEVPAAKRPQIYPWPQRVMTNTPILWRAYNSFAEARY